MLGKGRESVSGEGGGGRSCFNSGVGWSLILIWVVLGSCFRQGRGGGRVCFERRREGVVSGDGKEGGSCFRRGKGVHSRGGQLGWCFKMFLN